MPPRPPRLCAPQIVHRAQIVRRAQIGRPAQIGCRTQIVRRAEAEHQVPWCFLIFLGETLSLYNSLLNAIKRFITFQGKDQRLSFHPLEVLFCYRKPHKPKCLTCI